MKSLWVEKYRPDTLDGYVFVNNSQATQINKWITDKSIPHLLFSGSAGTGKTTLAKILIKTLGINEYDVKEINASREASVDHVRDTVEKFATTKPFGDFKVILLDEADYLSAHAQATLRGIMETYHETTRFILTCNKIHKIIPALQSRCQGFHITSIDQNEFTARAATVLFSEKIDFDMEILDEFVKKTYPDLRKCLNWLQANSIDGKLTKLSNDLIECNFIQDAIKLFKAGQIREARRTICDNIVPTDVDGIIRWSYDNLELWSSSDAGQDKAILIIRNAAANVPLVADPEINLSAMFIELAGIQEDE